MTATITKLEEENRTLRDAVEARLGKPEDAPENDNQSETIPVDWILRGQRELEEAEARPEPPVFRLRGDSLLQADDDPPAARMLTEAAAAVRQRRATYGPPANHFAMTVALINARFGTSFKPEDWATIMQLDKIARSAGPTDHPDNDVDGAGYAACRHEIIATRP